MIDMYILNDQNEPVPAKDMDEWSAWFSGNFGRRVVARDAIGNMTVSTVFLGLDHSFGEGPPLLYETIVFGPESYADLYCQRYSTWNEAVLGHQAAVQKVKNREVKL